MKDFTTPEYITPIINEISALFTPITDRVITTALHCDLLLQNNHSRNAYAITAGEPFYYRGTKALLQELKSYAETAATEAGELDAWMYREESRIHEAIRDTLLATYTA